MRFLRRRFRPHSSPLPPDAGQFIAGLRAFAEQTGSLAHRNDLLSAADALERVTIDAPAELRDEFTHVFGRAYVDFRSEVREMVDVGKETRLLVQEVHNDLRLQGAAVGALRAEFHDGMQAFGERLTDLEASVAAHDDQIRSFAQSRDRSIEDRRRHDAQIDRLEQGREQNRQAIQDLAAGQAELTTAVRELMEMVGRERGDDIR